MGAYDDDTDDAGNDTMGAFTISTCGEDADSVEMGIFNYCGYYGYGW